MLHDMRNTYIRRESSGFQDRALPILRDIAFFAAGMVALAALLYLRVQWGPVIGVDEAAVLYAP